MKNVALTVSLLISAKAYGQENHANTIRSPPHDETHHTHEEDHSREELGFDTKAYVLTLEGTQGFGEPCYLGVKDEGLDNKGLYFAEVETSFAHGATGPGVLHVSQDPKNPQNLMATQLDGSRISIQLSKDGTDVSDALRYAVRWKHSNHFDTGLCSDLKVIHSARL